MVGINIKDSTGKFLFEGPQQMVEGIRSRFIEEQKIASEEGTVIGDFDELLKDCISLEVEALQDSYTIYF